MKPLNQLTQRFTESVIRGMSRVCAAHGGINLAQGFPDWDAPAELVEAAVAALREGHNQYAVTWGQEPLRRAIAAKTESYNRFPVDPEEEITVTCGATEGMIATLKAIINPGDEVVIFEPFYENYGPDTLLSGATPRYVTLRPPDWSFDPDELAAAFGPRTKAIVMNTPNNPTGKVFRRDELETIGGLCLEHDCFCVSDDIYEHILYDGAEHVSMASLPEMGPRTITINSISKTYSATGWRVGWVIAPPEVTAAVRKVHDFLTVGAPCPLQMAAAAALEFPRSYYEELAARYDQGRRTLFQALEAQGFSPNLPSGAYYIITQPTELMRELGAEDDFAFAHRLIELAGVAAVPGSSFYADGQKGADQVRFCFCKKPETLERAAEGLARLGRAGG
jgi:aminotransferase